MSVLRLTPPAADVQTGREAGLSLHQRELSWRLGWFVRMRWVAIAGLALGVVYGRLLIGGCVDMAPLFAFLGGIAGYNLVFTLVHAALRRVPRPRRRDNIWFALAQIFADLAALTLLVRATGGILSPFVICYVIHMVMSGMLLRRWACLLVAGVASVALDATACLPPATYELIPTTLVAACDPPTPFPPLHLGLFYNAIFFVTAAMASSIANRLRERERNVESINHRLAEVNVAKSRFMRTASHEMRSPLAAIQGLLGMLAQRVADPPPGAATPDEMTPLHLIERCKIRANYLHELVNDLLEYSRLQSISLEQVKKPLDWAGVVGAALEEHEPVARTKGVNLSADLEPCRILGDEQQLLTLSRNLIDNALRYTPTGGRVAVRLAPAGRRAVLEVEDNGIGIDPSSIHYVFDEFFRAPNAKDHEAGGTGLGLTMCKSIVENHAGTIGVTSVPRHRTLVTVRLPLREGR